MVFLHNCVCWVTNFTVLVVNWFLLIKAFGEFCNNYCALLCSIHILSALSVFVTSSLTFQVGARLISHAGSLTNLAKYPASTVQILGAEKALFRYCSLHRKSNEVFYLLCTVGILLFRLTHTVVLIY